MLTLSEWDRAIYLNHRLRGLSYCRIAKRLGITTAEVELFITCSLYQVHSAFLAIERERRP